MEEPGFTHFQKEHLMKKMIRISGGTLCVCIAWLAVNVSAQQTFDPMRPAPNPLAPMATSPSSNSAETPTDPELGDLPIGVGAEETYYQCIACHSTAIIRQQRLTDARWDYLWGWMIDEQGMYEPDDETKAIVMEYLKTHFSSER